MPKSGTETITGTVTGAAVAAWLNSTGRKALPEPPFVSLVLTGLVSTMTSAPMSLRGNGPKTAAYTFVTPAGKLVIQRVIKTRGGGPPAATGQSGSTCYFTQNGGSGAYTVLGSKSSGKFAGATGHGTYTILILAEAKLLAGKTVCVVSNTGNVITKGASITFRASGPLTLK